MQINVLVVLKFIANHLDMLHDTGKGIRLISEIDTDGVY